MLQKFSCSQFNEAFNATQSVNCRNIGCEKLHYTVFEQLQANESMANHPAAQI